jgi:hypothetical protein
LVLVLHCIWRRDCLTHEEGEARGGGREEGRGGEMRGRGNFISDARIRFLSCVEAANGRKMWEDDRRGYLGSYLLIGNALLGEISSV